MLIYGRKLVYRKLGYVADLCALCHAITPHTLSRVGSAFHIYLASVSQGSLVGFERSCLACKAAVDAQPATYKALAKKYAGLEDLIAQTYPTIREVLSQRLAQEASLKTRPLALPPEVRVTFLRDPFLALSSKVEKRFAHFHFDKEICFAVLGGLLLMGALMGLYTLLFPALPPTYGAYPAFFAGCAVVVWQGKSVRRRYLRRQIIPAVSDSLRPLQPSEQEMLAVLITLAEEGHQIARHMWLEDLMGALDRDNVVR